MSEYQIRQQQMEAERKFHAHLQINGYIEQMKALESENARLREALGKIQAYGTSVNSLNNKQTLDYAAEIAKSALEGEK